MMTVSTDTSSKALSAVAIKWICLLLALTLLPILAGLGVWQLQRAEQKQRLIDRSRAEPLAQLVAPSEAVMLPQAVVIDAKLDMNHLWLLDNRTRDGRVGYELLLPFEDRVTGRWGIVNLGWQAAAIDRAQLPRLQLTKALSQQVVSLHGMLVSAQAGYQLGDDRWSTGWPKRIQQPDMARFEQLLGRALYPALVRLTEPVELPVLADLDSRWKLVNMPPQQHLGYALQWFGLALALTVWLAWFGWWRTGTKPVPAAAQQSDPLPASEVL